MVLLHQPEVSLPNITPSLLIQDVARLLLSLIDRTTLPITVTS